MSAGVIGGADGPTAVFVTGNPWAAIAVGVLVLAAIVLAVVLWRRRKK
ncbi:MAG: LPXTG cell wall anchor domain-containing protein [Candidatus Onthomonas sp.]